MERLTPTQADIDQRALVAKLHARGLGAGDRLAVIAGNSARYINLAMGALRAGIVPVLINPALLPHERQRLLDDARPGLIVTEADWESLDDGPGSGGDVELGRFPLGRPMLYTSGTTGTPKGVWAGVLSAADGEAMYAEEIECWDFRPGDVHLVTSRLYHSAPLRFAMCSLLAGGDVVIPASGADASFTSTAWCEAVVATRPTSTFLAPAHLQRLRNAGLANANSESDRTPTRDGSETADGIAGDLAVDLSSFRRVLHAGAPCPDDIKAWATETFPEGSVWEFYGSTEGQFTVSSPEDWRAAPASVGRARKNRRLRVDPDGVIWCAVPDHARFEYWERLDATEAAWNGNEFSVFDLGRIDDDGYVYLDGRRDDLIISGGVNVYPLEVEIELRRCPGVDDVAVFGRDDDRWGQAVCAVIVGNVDEAEVSAWARDRLAAHKRPKHLFRAEAIPTTPTGKVKRSRLAQDLGI